MLQRNRIADLGKVLTDLQNKCDEQRLQIHLASKEAEDEWKDLVAAWDRFLSRAQFDKSAEEVGEAGRQLSLKMKAAYDRTHSAL
ncbi:hypothetical protein CLV78_11820 [Aliiruegeria haliotis]|uniref:Uncharacterized protein n=1 Tax=Aliiruegeria haliotis TaxID=1280846 RepID=A0A2T0RF38_9RHOB|nr:hypothetical protein [Aliiruegeria haliotis]PRY19777.1 hypothetical protein CLV78_11820 [Aliiruegeria haliotis]